MERFFEGFEKAAEEKTTPNYRGIAGAGGGILGALYGIKNKKSLLSRIQNIGIGTTVGGLGGHVVGSMHSAVTKKPQPESNLMNDTLKAGRIGGSIGSTLGLAGGLVGVHRDYAGKAFRDSAEWRSGKRLTGKQALLINLGRAGMSALVGGLAGTYIGSGVGALASGPKTLLTKSKKD